MKWEMIHSMKTLEVTNLKGGKNTYQEQWKFNHFFFYKKLKVEEKTY